MTEEKKTELKKTVSKKKPSTATKKPKVAKEVIEPHESNVVEVKTEAKPFTAETIEVSDYIANFRKKAAKRVKLKSFGDQECLVYTVTVDFRKDLSAEKVTDEKVEEIISDLVRDLDGNKIFTEECTAFGTFGDAQAYAVISELIDLSLVQTAKNS